MSRRTEWLWIILLGGSFLLIGLALIPSKTYWYSYDCYNYLALAQEIDFEGGPLRFISDFFTGRYRYANGQPLYPLILSLAVHPSESFFVTGKILTLLLSLGTVMTLFFSVRRLFGFFEAMITSVLFAFGSQYLEHATLVTPDPLFVGFIVLSWWGMIESLRQEKNSLIFLSGLAAGLAYMTKGNGLFLLAVCGLGFLGLKGARGRTGRQFIYFLMGFLLVSFPLFWRNTLVYGSPLYNDNSLFLWVEDFAQVWADEFYINPPTFSSFLAEHGIAGMVLRYSTGLFAYAFLMLEDLRPLGMPFYPHLVLGIPFLGLSLYSLTTDKDRERRIVSLGIVGIFWVFFGWFIMMVISLPNVARFALPVTPILLAYGAAGFIRLYKRTGGQRIVLEKVSGIASGIILLILIAVTGTYLMEEGFGRIRYDYTRGTDDPIDARPKARHWVESKAELGYFWVDESLLPSERLYGQVFLERYGKGRGHSIEKEEIKERESSSE